MNIFDLMSIEGHIWVFDPRLGDFSLQFFGQRKNNSDESSGTLVSFNSENGRESRGWKDFQQKSSYYAYVNVYLNCIEEVSVSVFV